MSSTQEYNAHPFTPFTDDTPPEFPSSLIPAPIREMVMGKARELEVPPIMPMACAFGVLSAVVQSRWAVEVRHGWIEPLSTFWAIVADPGELKTPTMRPFVRPLVEYERSERERADGENKANASTAECLEQRVKQLRRDAAKADDPSVIAKQMDDLASEIPPTERPNRVIADDATPERLARLMAENHGAMSVITDEGGAFLGRLAGHYSNGCPNIDAVLKGFDNGMLRIDRSNGNDVHLNHARLAICLMVQKSVARSALTNREFMDRGLVHRFLWGLPGNTRVGRRTFDAPPVPDHVESGWGGLVRELLSWSPAAVDEWGTTTHLIKISQPGSDRLGRYVLKLEGAAGQLDEADPRRTYRLKWRGYVVRLAGLIHCMTIAADKPGHAPHQYVISEDTITHAIALGWMLLDHADTAMGMLVQDLNLERAKRILARVRALDGEVSHRDLWLKLRRVTSLFDSHDQFNDAVELLLKHGYLAWRSEGKSDLYVYSQSALEASP